MATSNIVFPLKVQAVSTATTTALATGTIRPYNASAGALAPVLPALSTVVDDDYLIVEKDGLDTSSNAVTVTCAGSDTFSSGTTTTALTVRGERVELQAATVGGTRVWKVMHHTIPKTGLDSRYSQTVAAPTGTAALDDAAIMAAYNALPASGGTLRLKEGLYATAGDVLSFTKQVNIVGSGSGAGLSDASATRGSTVIGCASATATAVKLQAPGSRISELAIVNTGYIVASGSVTPTAGAGLLVNAASGALIERLVVQGFYDNLVFDKSYYLNVDKCRIFDPVRYGLYFNNTISVDEGDWSVTGCTFTPWSKATNPTAAVRHESGGGMRFIGNKINGGPNTDHPFAGNFTSGIQVYMADGVTTSDVQIVGNSIENVSTGYGIDAKALGSTGKMWGVVISGNELGYGTGAGVRIGAGIQEAIVNGNVFQNLTGSDIYLDAGLNGARVTGNVHRSSGTTPRLFIATGATNVFVDPVFSKVNNYAIQDNSGSNDVAMIHHRYVLPIPAVANTTPVTIARLAIGAYNGGTFDLNVGGSASTVGAFAYRFSRSFSRATGAVGVTIIGTDYSVGPGAAEAVFTFDTTSVSGEVQVKVAAVNAHALYGRCDLQVFGQPSSVRLGA